jgi:hypothetical protein
MTWSVPLGKPGKPKRDRVVKMQAPTVTSVGADAGGVVREFPLEADESPEK